MGLPSDTNSVNLSLDLGTLDKIPSELKDTAIKLFEDYDNVFAQSDTNIGKYGGGAHKIDTGLNPLPSPKPSDNLKPLKKLPKLRFQNFWSLGYWSNHKAYGPPPCYLSRKKDGSNQVVIDYCCLNLLTKKNPTPYQ